MLAHALMARNGLAPGWVVYGYDPVDAKWRLRERSMEPVGEVFARAIRLIEGARAPVIDFTFVDAGEGTLRLDGDLEAAAAGLALDWQDLAVSMPGMLVDILAPEGKANDETMWTRLVRVPDRSKGLALALRAPGVDKDARVRVQRVTAAAQAWCDTHGFSPMAGPAHAALLVRPTWVAREIDPAAYGLPVPPYHGLERPEREEPETWREQLGLLWEFTEDDVETAFKTRAKLYHPDGNGAGGDPVAMRRLIDARKQALDYGRKAW